MSYTWPHTMKRGVFKGRTFESVKEYHQAIQDHTAQFGPTRKVGVRRVRSAAPATTNGESERYIRKIVDGYDLLVGQGIGKAAAVKILDKLVQ
jgi:hypothetical protein